jgi:hypothetical protein
MIDNFTFHHINVTVIVYTCLWNDTIKAFFEMLENKLTSTYLIQFQ